MLTPLVALVLFASAQTADPRQALETSFITGEPVKGAVTDPKLLPVKEAIAKAQAGWKAKLPAPELEKLVQDAYKKLDPSATDLSVLLRARRAYGLLVEKGDDPGGKVTGAKIDQDASGKRAHASMERTAGALGTSQGPGDLPAGGSGGSWSADQKDAEVKKYASLNNTNQLPKIDGEVPALVVGADGSLSQSDRALDMPGTLEDFEVPADKGQKRIKQVHDAVLADYGDRRLGNGKGGSFVGNTVNMSVDAWNDGDYVLAGAAGVFGFAGLAIASTKDWLITPERPKKDPEVDVPAPNKDTKGPFIICTQWADGNTGALKKFEAELKAEGYHCQQVSTMIGVTHFYAACGQCKGSLEPVLLILDQWRSIKIQKTELNQLNVDSYAPGFKCP